MSSVAALCALLLLAPLEALQVRAPARLRQPALRRSPGLRCAEDWDDAWRDLAASRDDLKQFDSELKDQLEVPEGSTGVSVGEGLGGGEGGGDDAGGGGFRFERPQANAKYTAGLDTDPDSPDMRLLRVATLYGGRVLTALTLGSLCFYIYVGLSGGITDGFDRFQEPIEDIRVTMENMEMDAANG